MKNYVFFQEVEHEKSSLANYSLMFTVQDYSNFSLNFYDLYAMEIDKPDSIKP